MASFNVELNSKPLKNTSEYNLLLRITVNQKACKNKIKLRNTQKAV
jgi:hypothetical protein